MAVDFSFSDGMRNYGSTLEINPNEEEESVASSMMKSKYQSLSGNRVSFEILGDKENGDVTGISLPTWREHSMRDSTVVEAILNSVNYFVGIGVLSIPYAMRSGWICVVNMLVLGVVFGITGELIGLCQQKLGSKTYPDIAEAAFGFTGRILVSIVYYVQLLFDLVLFFNLFVASASQLFGGEQFLIIVCVTALMVAETHVFTTMRRASALSLVGAVTGLLLCAALFLAFCIEIGLRERTGVVVTESSGTVSGSSNIISPPHSSYWLTALVSIHKTLGGLLALGATGGGSGALVGAGMPMGHTVFLNPSVRTQVVSFGIISFSYMGHAVWPSVFHSMLSPNHYRTVVWVTIVLITIWYTLVAAFGYYLYGSGVHDNVSLDIRLGKWFLTFLNALICLTVGAKFALAAFPIVECFEDLLDSEYIKSALSNESQWYSSEFLPDFSMCGRSVGLCVSACKRSLRALTKGVKRAVEYGMVRVRRYLFGRTPLTAAAFRPIGRRTWRSKSAGDVPSSNTKNGTMYGAFEAASAGERTPLLQSHKAPDADVGADTNSSVSTDGSVDTSFEELLAPIRVRQKRWFKRLRVSRSADEAPYRALGLSQARTYSGSSIDDGEHDDCDGQHDEEAKCEGGVRQGMGIPEPSYQNPPESVVDWERLQEWQQERDEHESEMTNREKDLRASATRARCLLIVRTMLPVVVLLLYLALPSFLQLVTIIGGVFGTLICLVFPLLFYLCLCRNEMSMSAAATAWVGVIAGVGITVAVSIASV